jgi:hypothetical protein
MCILYIKLCYALLKKMIFYENEFERTCFKRGNLFLKQFLYELVCKDKHLDI